MSEHTTAAVRAAEDARCAAMLANDATGLDRLLDERLQFHHSSGAVDDKTAYLAKMAGGRIAYISIEWSEERVTPFGAGTALLTGRMTTVVSVEGVTKTLLNRVLSAWADNGGTWQMVAFQSTPLAA